MPRREFFSPAQRLELMAIPKDEGELIRLFTLSTQDLAIIRERRGASTNMCPRADSDRYEILSVRNFRLVE